MPSPKQWWAPIWKGLVMDEEAKHYRKMRNALWLFLYLLLNANRQTGFLARKIRTISADMGLSRDTILRWLNALRKDGYVTTQNTGRYLTIQIMKWKPIPGARRTPRQRWQVSNLRSWRDPTRLDSLHDSNSAYGSLRTPVSPQPNDIALKNTLDNDTKNMATSSASNNVPKGVKPGDRAELLAQDLAAALNDRGSLPLYLSYARRYPESLLRRALGEVQEMPARAIKKSRGALFNHLVQKYAQGTDDDSGD